MPISFEVSEHGAFAALQGASERVMARFTEELVVIEQEMLADARSRAVAHFHSLGDKPGLYLAGFAGGVTRKRGSAIGWVHNSNELAHLFEKGYTISDMLIAASAGAAMAFDEAGVGTLYRRYIHRPTTPVPPYPAVAPAFEARKADVQAAAERAVEDF